MMSTLILAITSLRNRKFTVFLTVLAGVLLGTVLMYGVILFGGPMVESKFGIYLTAAAPSLKEWGLMGCIIATGTIIGLIPAFRSYRCSLADGLTVRV